MKTLDPKRRVVVTGLGVVSSLGIGWEEFWKNLLAGKSGISRIENFDTSGHDRHYAGEIKRDFSHLLTKDLVRKYGRTSQLALAASQLALDDAHFDLENRRHEKGIICVGTTAWEIGILEQMGNRVITGGEEFNDHKEMVVMPGNTISASITKALNLTALNHVYGNACASGNYAIGTGFDYIKHGMADFAIVGGADGMSRVVFTGFARLLAVASEKCQPFDLNRQGMIPGEGAGMLILETLESAQNRKAKIYAEVLGYGLSCDGHNMTNPDSRGVAKAIRKSLAAAKIKPEDVDYISAHGTGTIENDRAECDAINEVFGHLRKKPPMSSIKSMLGHTMGAAAALESIACCLAIKYGDIPPTINFENQDPFCDIDCVANKSRKLSIGVALNNSQAFGGNNNSVIFIKERES